MTKVVFHIGLPKCASTSIQEHFSRSYRANQRRGVLYPKSGRNWRGGLAVAHTAFAMAKDEDFPDLLKDLTAECKGAKSVLISSELFTNFISGIWRFERTINALNTLFGAENVEINLLVRNHFSFLESAFGQFITGGCFQIDKTEFFTCRNDQTIEGYADVFREKNGFFPFDYAAFFQLIRAAAPQNAIDVISVEKADLRDTNVVDLFETKLGITRDWRQKLFGKPPRQANTRKPTVALLGLRYALQTYPLEVVMDKRRSIYALFETNARTGSHPDVRVSARLHDTISAAQARDKAFFDTLGLRFPAVFEAPARAPTPDIRPDDVELTAEDKTRIDRLFHRPPP